MRNSMILASDFATNVLPIMRYILFAIIIASAVIVIITTLLQSSENSNSLDAFTGTKQESYYSQNKGASRDVILKRITIALSIVIAVCILTFFITELVASLKAA